MVVGEDTITILTVDDQPDLVYDIKRRPGYYAKATGERIPLSDVAMTQFMTKSLCHAGAAASHRLAVEQGPDRRLRGDPQLRVHAVADAARQFRRGVTWPTWS